MAPVITTDSRTKAFPMGRSSEKSGFAVGVGFRSRGGDRSSNIKLVEVKPDLTDVLNPPGYGELARGGDGVAGPNEVGVVQPHRVVATN